VLILYFFFLRITAESCIQLHDRLNTPLLPKLKREQCTVGCDLMQVLSKQILKASPDHQVSQLLMHKSLMYGCLFPGTLILDMKSSCHAAASAAAWSCGDSVSVAELEVTAQALAKATAEAYSSAYSTCRLDDGGYACAISGTSISAWVEAVVRTWAEAWAVAIECKDSCFVDVEAVVDAVGKIQVDAATDAYAFLCSGTSSVSNALTISLFRSCHGDVLVIQYVWKAVTMCIHINYKQRCAVTEQVSWT
jgi:hypothetical protein